MDKIVPAPMRQWNLTTWQRCLAIRYGLRSAAMVGGISQRGELLGIAITNFSRAYQRGWTNQLPGRLATAFAWVCCVADYFGFDHFGQLRLPLVNGLMKRYPRVGCANCGKTPCVCSNDRLATRLSGDADPEQFQWSLDQWGQFFWELYGAANQRHSDPVRFCISRCSDEVSEVAEISRFGRRIGKATPQLLVEMYGLELADVLAWLFGIAMLAKIDLSAALAERHGLACPVCAQEVCNCGPFDSEGSIAKLTADLESLTALRSGS